MINRFLSVHGSKLLRAGAATLLLCVPGALAQVSKQNTPALPATCTAGDAYVSATDGIRYSCVAANTWTKQAAAAAATGLDGVAFVDSGNVAQDNVNFVWDAANHRLGLGNPNPANRLDILNGSIKLNSGRNTPEAFNLSGRVGVGFPVPYFTPTTDNSIIAFDVYPKGKPNNYSSTTGVAWFDLCSTDVNSTPGYECLRMGKFANGDAQVSAVWSSPGQQRNLDLQLEGGYVGIGTRTPPALLSVGATSPFQVNSNGNIVKLNNVATNFPAKNAPGYLTNDGNGNFSYTPVSGNTAKAAYVASALPAAPAVGTVVKVTDGASISDCTSGSGGISRSCEWNGREWEFSPTGGYVLSSEPGSIPAASISFAAPGMAAVAAKEGYRQYVVAKACQITNLYLNVGGEQPTSGTVTVTVRIASAGKPPVDTALTASVPAGSQPGTVVSDTAHKADVAAGDLISIRTENSGSAPATILTTNLYCAY